MMDCMLAMTWFFPLIEGWENEMENIEILVDYFLSMA